MRTIEDILDNNQALKKFLRSFRPLNDMVLCQVFKDKEIGGIIIPETGQQKGQRCVVLAVGQGGWERDERKPMRVKVGDEIFVAKFAGSEVRIAEENLLIMHEYDIFGIYTGQRQIDLQPLDNRVFVEWEEGINYFKGSKVQILTSVQAQRWHYTGIVLAKGEDVKDEGIQVGKRVFFDQFCGPERVDFEEKRYALINEQDIYCELPLRSPAEIEVTSQ